MLFFTNLIKSELQNLVHLVIYVLTMSAVSRVHVIGLKKATPKNKKMLRNLTLCEGEIKAAVQEAIDGIAT